MSFAIKSGDFYYQGKNAAVGAHVWSYSASNAQLFETKELAAEARARLVKRKIRTFGQSPDDARVVRATRHPRR